MDVGLRAIADARDHHLGEDEAFSLLSGEGGAGFLEGVVAEELPLGGAQPENGAAVPVHEVAPVLADPDGEDRLVGGGARRERGRGGCRGVCWVHPLSPFDAR